MQVIIKLSFLILILTIYSSAQESDKVIATVGNYKITESEFTERFDFSVHPGLLKEADRDSVKLDFLNQLVAEKLLSLEAREKGFDTTSVLKNILLPLENMYIRDMLYQQEIKKKVKISADDITTGLQRIKKTLKLKFFFSKDRNEIQNIYLQLSSGASFDSLLSLRREAADQGVPREITFGTMEKEIEDSVYKLKTGEFTYPVASQDGYYILKLIGATDNDQNKSTESLIEEVKKIVTVRNEFSTYLNYYRKFFSPYRIAADRQVFESLIPELLSNFRQKYLQPDSSGKLILIGPEVTSVYRNIPAELTNKVFINLGDKKIKIDYFLNELSHTGFSVQSLNEPDIRASLSSYIRKFIEDELLTAEGIRKGFKENQDVRKYMTIWSDSYLSKMLMLSILDTLKKNQSEKFSGTEELYSEQVNIVEVLTDSLTVMEKIINEIAAGKSLRDLAKEYTIRDSLKNRGGEFGFFPVTEHGELGQAAARMNIGDIYGPIRTSEGYSIFQLIDRRIDSIAARNAAPELREQYLMSSTLSNFERYMNTYNAKLAQKYGVKINEDVLKKTEDVFMNLVVVRYMGFGGQIFAVPYTEQFSGWYRLWKNSVPRP